MDELATYERIKNLALNPLSSFLFFSPPPQISSTRTQYSFFFGISRGKKKDKNKIGNIHPIGVPHKTCKELAELFCIKRPAISS
jgi:hypothetical protein